jgi:predicted metal-dependent phosphoesterase TrpH
VITELHCHTTASDGLLSPTEVVQLARRRDVELLAITDHDTIDAHDEAVAAGRDMGVRVLPGIEVSSLSTQGEVHVLGYGVQPRDDRTLESIRAMRQVRQSRARGMLAKLGALGVDIPFERVKAIAGDAMIGRPHVARALVEAGVVTTTQQAFDRYLAEGGSAFVPHDGLTPPQAISLIHASGGLAVLAHPALYRGDLGALLTDLLIAGLDGIEAFYPLHTPAQTVKFTVWARQNGLLVTGGSDFHGAASDLEVSLGSIHVPDEYISALEARMRTGGR